MCSWRPCPPRHFEGREGAGDVVGKNVKNVLFNRPTIFGDPGGVIRVRENTKGRKNKSVEEKVKERKGGGGGASFLCLYLFSHRFFLLPFFYSPPPL